MTTTAHSTAPIAGTAYRPLARVLSGLLAGLVVAAGLVAASASPAAAAACPPLMALSYTDVPQGHPFCREIESATSDGWVTGYPDGTFQPAATITRQAAAAMLWRAANVGAMPSEPKPCEPGNPSAFPDVPESHPFCGHIRDVAAVDVLQGYGDGTFRPDAPITRQAIAAAFVRFFHAEVPVWVLPACATPPFDDVATSHPFCPHIAWMAEYGVTTGYDDGTFRPGAPVTRQAFVAQLTRLLVLPT